MNTPLLLALLSFAAGASAQGTAPVPTPAGMESPACREAMAALQAEEAKLAAPGRAASGASAPASAAPDGRAQAARLQALRERASRACLGGPSARPAPTIQSPAAVPPVSRPAPAPPVRAPMASPPPPPVVTPGSGMPQTVVACDSTGCTASDGTRLNKVGPTLVGPKGACTLEGAVLRCPP